MHSLPLGYIYIYKRAEEEEKKIALSLHLLLDQSSGIGEKKVRFFSSLQWTTPASVRGDERTWPIKPLTDSLATPSQ